MSDAEKNFNRQRLAAMDRVRCDNRLSGSIRAVGGELFSLSEFRLGYAYPSEAYLVEKLGVSVRTVKMAVKALQQAGYFEVLKRGRNNLYRPIFSAGEQVQSLHLSETRQVQNLHLSNDERGKIRPEQVQKTSGNRGKKVPPISLENSLGPSAAGSSGPAGAPDGAGGPSIENKLGAPGALLQKRLGKDVFESWFGKAAIVSAAGDEVTLALPTKFLADYVKIHFESAILECWRAEHDAGIDRIVVVVRATPGVESLGDRRAAVSEAATADARWLIDAGIGIVRERLFVSAGTADQTIVNWLQRCGNDTAGLRRIIADAAEQNLTGEHFRNVVKQRTKALQFADQTSLLAMLPPVPIRRRAS